MSKEKAKEMGLHRDIVNVNGSGIALGHPVGATGCRLSMTLIHEMAKRDLTLGLATLCVEGGLGFGEEQRCKLIIS